MEIFQAQIMVWLYIIIIAGLLIALLCAIWRMVRKTSPNIELDELVVPPMGKFVVVLRLPVKVGGTEELEVRELLNTHYPFFEVGTILKTFSDDGIPTIGNDLQHLLDYLNKTGEQTPDQKGTLWIVKLEKNVAGRPDLYRVTLGLFSRTDHSVSEVTWSLEQVERLRNLDTIKGRLGSIWSKGRINRSLDGIKVQSEHRCRPSSY